MMATLQEEVKPNNVVKSKNVAKKSTTKLPPSRCSSRSGSPCTMPSSITRSREASPDVHSSQLNGQLKQHATMPGMDCKASHKLTSNGPLSATKHGMEESSDSMNPAKQARLQIDQIKQQHDDMLHIAAGGHSTVSADSTDHSGTSVVMNSSNGSVSKEDVTQLGKSITEKTDTSVSSSTTSTTVTDGQVTVRGDQEAANSTPLSKSNIIQATDALQECLKAAGHKFSSDKSQSSMDHCSDGEHPPSVNAMSDHSNTPTCSNTPNPSSSPVTPRPRGMLDKGNLFEIMTLDLGKSSRECPGSLQVNGEVKPGSDSMDNSSKSSSENAPESQQDGFPAPGTKSEDAKDNSEDSKAVDPDVTKDTPSEISGKSVNQPAVSSSETSGTKVQTDNDEEEMLLLGVTDTNENFDAIDDSILDEEPKKEPQNSIQNCELEKGKLTETADSFSDSRDPKVIDKTEDVESVSSVESEVGEEDEVKKEEADLVENAVNDGGNHVTDTGSHEPGEVDVKVECSPSDLDDGSMKRECLGQNKLPSSSSSHDSNKRRHSDDSQATGQVKKGRTDVGLNNIHDVNSDPEQSSPASSSEMKDEKVACCNGSTGQMLTDAHSDVTDDSAHSPDVKPGADGILRLSKQALENLISKKVKDKLASSETVKLITDLRTRIDKLTEQLNKCKCTAKSYQIKISEITKAGRDRRRASKGAVRNVAVQVDILKQQASQLPSVQRGSPRSQSAGGQAPGQQSAGGQAVNLTTAQPPAIAPKVSAVNAAPVGGQTLLVPVASASASGTMTLIAPSAGTNIQSAQYRITAMPPHGAKMTGVTVREMLDKTTKQPQQTQPVPPGGAMPYTVPSGTKPTTQSDTSQPEKVIDLTEDDEGGLHRQAPTPMTRPAPGQVMVQGSMPPTSNGTNIPTGTYLVPVTSGQPILLQSVVTQQIPQQLVLSSTASVRPPGAQQPPQQQQLVTLAPAQPGMRPVLVQPSQPVAISKAPVCSQAMTKSQTTTSHSAKGAASRASKHPAPLPPQPTTSKVGPEYKALPPRPKLTISRVPQGIVLSWNLSLEERHATIANYQLYAYQEGTSSPVSSLWKKVGDVKALPLPMACTLTQFHEGNKYHFAVRGVDEHGRIGPFSEPNSIHLDATTSS